jgi:hypothetical protein
MSLKIKSNFFKASRAHVLKAATDFIRIMKTKNQQHQKTIEELKRQNAAVELQSNYYLLEILFDLLFVLARLLERVKETGQYTRHIHNHHNQEQIIKVESELNGIQTTRNLLTNENNSSISSHP